MGHELPDDWRERFVEMVRGTQDLDDDWFTGGPELSGLEQVAIYRNQYRMRLYDALVDEVPGLAHLLGGGAEPTLRAFLWDRPSQSWTLSHVADGLVEWLEERQNRPWVVEMARLDHAVQSGFDAADGAPIDPATLGGMPALRLQPHVTLLELTWNVHRIRSAALKKRDVPAREKGPWFVVVFRKDRRMRHWEMPRGAFAILKGIDEGLGVQASIERAFGEGLLNPETLPADIGQWFQDYAKRNLVEVL